MSSHLFALHGTAEGRRMAAADSGQQDWRAWGPYLSERAWGTVREDYSEDGSAWDYFPHDHARSRAGPRLIAGRPDRHLDHFLVHVDPRDALMQHFHTQLPPAAAPPGQGQARRLPGLRPVQDTDTRARSSNGGYPPGSPRT